MIRESDKKITALMSRLIVLLVLGLVLSTAILYVNIIGLRENVRDYERQLLQQVTRSVNQSLQNFFSMTLEIFNDVVVSNQDFKLNLQRLLEQGEQSPATSDPQTIEFFEDLFAKYSVSALHEYIYILNSDYEILFSYDQQSLLELSPIAVAHPNKMALAFNGEQVVLPVAHFQISNWDGNEGNPVTIPIIYLSVPIYGEDNIVAAVMLFPLDPTGMLAKIMQNHHFEKTGETFIFDDQGRLLSDSRFTQELDFEGLLDSDQLSTLNVSLVTPPVKLQKSDQPVAPGQFTYLATQALRGTTGSSAEPYVSYHGDEVLGAWLWNEDMGIGIGAEMHFAELFTFVPKVRHNLYLILGIGGTGFITIFIYLVSLHRKYILDLQHAREELYSILNNAADTFIAFDNKQKMFFINESGRHLFKLKSHQLQGKALQSLIDVEQMPEFKPWFEDSNRIDDLILEQTQLPMAQGRHINARVAFSRYALRNHLLYTAQVTDLTLRTEMENKIRMLELAFEKNETAIAIISLNKQVVYANKAAESLSKLRYGGGIEFLERNLMRNAHPLQQDQAAMTKVFQGESWQGEMVLEQPGLPDMWLTASLTPIINNQSEFNHVMLAAYDITNKKLIEQQIAKAKKLQDQTEVIAKSASWEWDVQNDLYQCSANMFNIMEVEPDKYRWQFSIVEERTDPEDFRKLCELREAALQSDKNYSFDCKVTTFKGNRKILRVTGEVERDSKQRPTRLLGLVQDVSEEIRNKQQLQQALQKAEVASNAKSRFLAAMSHEIRTPISGIVGMLDLLKQSELNQDQQHLADVASSSALSLMQIINEILDFSKIEEGKMTLESLPVNWEALLSESTILFVDQIRRKDLSVYCMVMPDMIEASKGDPVRLRQIVLNLLSNALKFTKSGRDRKGRIILKVSRSSSGDNIVFTVEDNGIGMSEEQQLKLFEAFTQADSSTHRKYGGTGLGLSICQNLVALMHGTIQCSSKLGQGTTMRVELPYVATDNGNTKVKEDNRMLAGALVATLPLEPMIDQYIEDFLGYFDVEVARLNRIEDISALATIPNLLMLPSNADAQQLEWISNRPAEMQNMRFILWSQLSNQININTKDEYVFVNVKSFVPSVLLQAIHIGLGYASPDIPAQAVAESSAIAPNIAEAEAQDKLLLIIEDNIHNQEVMTRQVNMLGYAAVVASDGEEGLSKFKQHSFSIVLTDCHMPIMDGFEFTRAVRGQPQYDHIPIIAVTANALQGERERCIQAGMNDYVTKPIDLKTLGDLLRTYSSGSQNTATSAQVPSPLDRALLRSYLGDDSNFHTTFMRSFVEQNEPAFRSIDELVHKQDFQALASLAHKLKSSTLSIGAKKLASLLKLLQTEATNANHATVAICAANVVDEYDRVKAYIDTQLAA